MHSCAAAPEGRQRHFARLEVRQSLTEALTCPLGLRLRVRPSAPRRVRFGRAVRGRRRRTGSVRSACARHKGSDGGRGKNGRTWGEITVNVQSTGQPGRRERLIGTDVAHGSSARMWRTDVAVRQKPWRRSKDRGGVNREGAAGWSPDRMKGVWDAPPSRQG